MKSRNALFIAFLLAATVAAPACMDGSTESPESQDLSFAVLDAADSQPMDALADLGDSGPAAVAAIPTCTAGSPGQVGCPCLDNSDCYSGFCVAGSGGLVCAATCEVECAPGLSCQHSANPAGDPVFLCLDRHIHLCSPCLTASDCKHPQALASADRCLPAADPAAGNFCATACFDDADCPPTAVCEASDDGKRYCRPASGECACSPFAIQRSATTLCERANAAGTCMGHRTCTGDGLSACDARLPAAETCNGLDDDCDGITDEALAFEPCSTANATGACAGVRACVDGKYTPCDAPEPTAEACNGADDDCDGATDEGLAPKACSVEVGAAACAGAQTCVDGMWSACAAVRPTPEICDGADNDCDGNTDETFAVGQACDGPDGDLCKDGVTACAANGAATCNEAPGPGHLELCSSIDDDCDGLTDEGFPTLAQPCDGPDADTCTDGVFACGPSGQPVCVEVDAGFAHCGESCGACPPPKCGDKVCNGAETAGSCPVDCEPDECKGVFPNGCKPFVLTLPANTKAIAIWYWNASDSTPIQTIYPTPAGGSWVSPVGACSASIDYIGRWASWVDGSFPAGAPDGTASLCTTGQSVGFCQLPVGDSAWGVTHDGKCFGW
jgi:hypothetical protein